LTAVTGEVRAVVTVWQAKPSLPAPLVGAPAAPRHSRIVTDAVPLAAVIVLTTVISQIRPLPPWLPRLLPHVVVGATVCAADTGEAARTDTGAKSARANKTRKREVNGRCMETPLTAPGPGVTTLRPTRSIVISLSLQASGERRI
jgi:hypothetical protein